MIIGNYASPHGSIYYIVALKVHMRLAKVLWAHGMQVEYMFVCSTHHQGLISQYILFQQCRPCDLKVQNQTATHIFIQYLCWLRISLFCFYFHLYSQLFFFLAILLHSYYSVRTIKIQVSKLNSFITMACYLVLNHCSKHHEIPSAVLILLEKTYFVIHVIDF